MKPDDDLAHADIGIVYATPLEISPFLDRCERVRQYQGAQFTFKGARYGKARIALVQANMGGKTARRATQSLIDGHTPRWVVSAGFSGALQPGLRVGDIVVADSVVDSRDTPIKLDIGMPADPAKGLHVGRLYQAEGILRIAAEKLALGQQSGALAVDMESLSVAEVCRENNRRFMAVRAISDDTSADLPPEIMTVVGPTGAVRWGATVAALFKRPSSAMDLWNLREQSLKVAQRLATFLEGVVVQLHAAP